MPPEPVLRARNLASFVNRALTVAARKRALQIGVSPGRVREGRPESVTHHVRAISRFPSTATRLPSTPEAIHHRASTEPRTRVRGPLGLPSVTALLFSSSSRGAQRSVEPRRERTALFNRGSVPAGRSARGGIGLQIRRNRARCRSTAQTRRDGAAAALPLLRSSACS
jgi:hypothetical protein